MDETYPVGQIGAVGVSKDGSHLALRIDIQTLGSCIVPIPISDVAGLTIRIQKAALDLREGTPHMPISSVLDVVLAHGENQATGLILTIDQIGPVAVPMERDALLHLRSEVDRALEAIEAKERRN